MFIPDNLNLQRLFRYNLIKILILWVASYLLIKSQLNVAKEEANIGN